MKRIALFFFALFISSVVCTGDLYSKPVKTKIQELITPQTPSARTLSSYVDVTTDTESGIVEVYFLKSIGEVTITLTNYEDGVSYVIYADSSIESRAILYFPPTEGELHITIEGSNYLAEGTIS